MVTDGMKYTDYLLSAKRHNHACKALKEKIEVLNSSSENSDELKFLVLSLYYLSGYIIECSLKFKIFEIKGFDKNAEINESECSRFDIDYKKRIKTHNFGKLQEYLDSLVSDITHTSESTDVNLLLNNWKPDIRYEHLDITYENIKIFYEHTTQFLKKV